MSDPLFERLSELRPQLAAQVRLFPQTYRGERWFVLANETRGSYLRFNAGAYAAIGRFDGNITLSDLHDLLAQQGDAPTQQELAAIVLQLASVGALRHPLPEDVQALTGGSATRPRNKAPFNPLALRFRMFDPDRLLESAMPWVAPLFTYVMGIVWLVIVVLATVLGVLHVNSIVSSINASLLAPANLLSAWLTFTAMKIVHEFAHAFAVKRWGGEVHEMGISLLVLAPVPYVDASASWTFRSKYRRALVGAVGILVELLIAALALMVFLAVEPGLVRSVALNAILIGGLSTLLVNGNPLLRFDGYYVLQDLLELPNLSSRSAAYLRYLLKHYGLRLADARPPAISAGERPWLVGYGIAAAAYRVFILAVIGLYLTSAYLVVGVALITWAVVMQLLVPAVRALRFVLTVDGLVGRRTAAIARVGALPAVLLAAIVFVPVSATTETQGIVWLPDQAQLYARADGFVVEVLVAGGRSVTAGTPILSLQNETLHWRRQALAARQRELQARRIADQFVDRAAAEVVSLDLAAVAAQIERVDEQQAALVVRSAHAGTLVYTLSDDLTGRYVRQGDLVAYVVDPANVIVRVAIPQRDIGRLHDSVIGIEVRLAERLEERLSARILRETPAGHSYLPSRALSRAGGGSIETQVGDPDALRTTDKVFHVDLALPPDTAVSGIGGRAYVRYRHTRAPLFKQWQARLRQLLLRRLSV